jgi:hypothetical protein
VVEHLPSKCEALSSNPTTVTKKINKKALPPLKKKKRKKTGIMADYVSGHRQ